MESIVGQGITQVAVFQCPLCARLIKNAHVAQPYPCPFGCECLLVLTSMYEEQTAFAATQLPPADASPRPTGDAPPSHPDTAPPPKGEPT
jgi:hypothetical protein